MPKKDILSFFFRPPFVKMVSVCAFNDACRRRFGTFLVRGEESFEE